MFLIKLNIYTARYQTSEALSFGFPRMSCEYAYRLKTRGLITLDSSNDDDDDDDEQKIMIHALKNIIGKEAAYTWRGSLNEHQTRQLGTNVK